MNLSKRIINRFFVIVLMLTLIENAVGQPASHVFFYGSGDIEVREEYLDSTLHFWDNNSEVLREPSPKLLAWYEREEEFRRGWIGGGKKDGYERVSSFLASNEYAHVELFYALQRVDRILGNIKLALDKKQAESELFGWIALSAEVSQCSDLDLYAEQLERSNEISSEAQQSISQFCRLIPTRLHRNIIMPFYQNLYLQSSGEAESAEMDR
jgi:hypothetical protein